MRRADRLFQIVQHLRARRLTTAAQLADWLGTSQRTIYRDIRDLSISGVPVQGEAGVGYRIDRSYDLTPLMFTPEEVEAVVVGIRMVQAFGGNQLRAASRSALEKVALALPQHRREETEHQNLYAPAFYQSPALGERLDQLRAAIASRQKLRVTYLDKQDRESSRTLRPLALYFWSTGWTLAAWCESRKDFRSFRLDRMRQCETSNEMFEIEEDKSLEAFLRSIGVS